MAGASDIRAGGAFVELYAKTALLVQGLKLAEAKLKQFGQAITTIGQRTAIAGAAIFTPFLLGAKSFASIGNDIWLLSKKTGAGVEALSLLGAAAEEVGGDLGTIGGALGALQGHLLQVAMGSMEARRDFRNLGLDVSALMKMRPEERLEAVADAIAKIRNPDLRGHFAGQLLGGKDLLPLLEPGKLGEAKGRAQAGGRGITREDAEAAHQMSVAMKQLKEAALSVWRAFGSTLAPIITNFTEKVKEGAARIREWIAENRKWVVGIALGGALLIGLGAALVAVGTAAKVAAIGFAIVSKALMLLGVAVKILSFAVALGPIGWAAIAVGALIVWKSWDKTVGALKEAFFGLKQTVVNTFGGITDALIGGDWALAGEIAVLGLKTAWEQIKLFALDTWTAIRNGLLDSMTDAGVGAMKAIFTAFFEIGRFIDNTIDWLKDLWDMAIGGWRMAFQEFVNFVADQMQKVSGIDMSDLIKSTAAIRDEVFAKVNKRAEERKGRQAAAEEKFQGAWIKPWEQEGAEEKRKREAERQEGLEPGRMKIQAMQMELGALRALAAGKAAAAGWMAPGGKPPDLGMIQERVGVKGGFLAMASAGMGRGDTIQTNMLAEQKGMHGELKDVNRNLQMLHQFGRFA